MKKWISLLVLILVQSSAFAAHNRLWVGFKKEDVSTADFMNGLNQVFFAKTVEVGQGKGLLAYQPYVTKMNGDLPDEVALVTYKDEESYKAIRSTKEGKEYGELHWAYFDKSTSKSTVPSPYKGNLQTEMAYELKPDFVDWQKGITYVNIYMAPRDLRFVQEEWELLKRNPNVNNAILVIKGPWLIEYRSVRDNAKAPLKMSFKVLEHKKLRQAPIAGTSIDFGDGVNFRF